MVGKFFKTKPCILFRRGRCPRHNCTFAHGDAELRPMGPPSSFDGRRDYRGGDLRDKLDRRHSPHRSYSPGRDVRGHHGFHRQKLISRDRGHSLSRSPIRRNERKLRRKQHLDGQSDASGSLKTINGTEVQVKEDKVSSYDEKDVFEEELKQMQFDIESLEDHKAKVENILEEKEDESHQLKVRIEDLDMQLNREQEDCKRITSKIKKFVRAHGRYLRAQEELKRSQSRLHRFGDQLGSDAIKLGVNEEDSSVNVISDTEAIGNIQLSPKNDELQNHASIRKRQRHYSQTSEETKLVRSRKREKFSAIPTRSEKFIKFDIAVPHSVTYSKEAEAMKAIHDRIDAQKSMVDDTKHKRGKISPNIPSMDKVKGFEAGKSLPSTGMAAHAVDELLEAIEMEEKSEDMEGNRINENGPLDNKASSSCIPALPPPVTKEAYKQHEADDEDVDVEKSDGEMVDIDNSSEVEIERG